jgi:hypothetical protein
MLPFAPCIEPRATPRLKAAIAAYERLRVRDAGHQEAVKRAMDFVNKDAERVLPDMHRAPELGEKAHAPSCRCSVPHQTMPPEAA